MKKFFDQTLSKILFKVNLNFFAEGHGKNCRDIHFSHISQFVKFESLKRKLTTSEDVVLAIQNGQKNANENSLALGILFVKIFKII